MNSKQSNKTQSKSDKSDHTVEQLMIAADTNDFAMCHKILSSNPNLINAQYPTIVNWLDKSPYNAGATAINYATRSGHYDMVYKLVNKYNANINSKDHENWNSLHYACNAGHYLLTKYLFENGVDDKLISLVEKCTPFQFAQYKKWNDIIYLLQTNNDKHQPTQHKYGLIEKQKIFKKTKERLHKLLQSSNSMHATKLCRYYKAFKPFSCKNGTKCRYAHLDINYNKLDQNKNIKLDLYLHRYQINWNIYYKLNENLCQNNTKTLVFQCVDTQVTALYDGNTQVDKDGNVWFIIYHDRYKMHEQRKLFEAVNGVRVIRSSSISKLDHILVLKVRKNDVKIFNIFANIIGDEIDIVGMKNANENDLKTDDDHDDLEMESKTNEYNVKNKWNTKLSLPNIKSILNNLKEKKLFVGFGDNSNVSLVNYCLFDNIDINYKYELIKQCIDNNKCMDRAIGTMYGMGIGDATGAPLEFLDCIRFHNKSYFSLKDKKWIEEYNKFHLKRGQWTDDAAMGLCMADSLINNKEFKGSDIRIRFWSWWNNGYCNAFKYDLKRQSRNSVGLGNNISKSIYSMKFNQTPSASFKSKGNKNDSGNGSLMRLAPIPIFYSGLEDIEIALKFAQYSSFTTHQGHIAAEACSLLTFIIINGINRDLDQNENIKMFLDRATKQYLNRINKEYADLLEVKKKNKTLERKLFAKKCIIKLLNGLESDDSKERCWNWRSKKGNLGIDLTMINRGSRYNGYPNSQGYFGSFCMDGIAMGLHSVYNSKSFGNAIENAVNLLGDADSTGSIAGQLAGSFYGFNHVFYDRNDEGFLFKQISKWDHYDFGLRAVLLYCIGKMQV